MDGHEREDVVEYRKMVGLGFLKADNAPTDAKKALPSNLSCPPRAPTYWRRQSSCFTMNLRFRPTKISRHCGHQRGHVIRPKLKGSGIMVLDFIEEKKGYLALTDEEYERAKQVDPIIKKHARQWLEYGEAKEGYWTSRSSWLRSRKQRRLLTSNTNILQRRAEKVVWISDHSSSHTAMSDDALDVSKMNVIPGGKQRVMRDTAAHTGYGYPVLHTPRPRRPRYSYSKATAAHLARPRWHA